MESTEHASLHQAMMVFRDILPMAFSCCDSVQFSHHCLRRKVILPKKKQPQKSEAGNFTRKVVRWWEDHYLACSQCQTSCMRFRAFIRKTTVLFEERLQNQSMSQIMFLCLFNISKTCLHERLQFGQQQRYSTCSDLFGFSCDIPVPLAGPFQGLAIHFNGLNHHLNGSSTFCSRNKTHPPASMREL